jgi:hypothetical protein
MKTQDGAVHQAVPKRSLAQLSVQAESTSTFVALLSIVAGATLPAPGKERRTSTSRCSFAWPSTGSDDDSHPIVFGDDSRSERVADEATGTEAGKLARATSSSRRRARHHKYPSLDGAEQVGRVSLNSPACGPLRKRQGHGSRMRPALHRSPKPITFLTRGNNPDLRYQHIHPWPGFYPQADRAVFLICPT